MLQAQGKASTSTPESFMPAKSARKNGIWVDNWRFPKEQQHASQHTQLEYPSQLLNSTPMNSYSSRFAPHGGDDGAVQAESKGSVVTPGVLLGLGGVQAAQTGELLYAMVILVVAVALVASSLAVIACIVCSERLRTVIGLYLVSLSVVDLLTATLLALPAVHSALLDRWGLLEPYCTAEAYLSTMLFCTHVYMFMWIGVDRYAAVHKPARYDVEQTYTRCLCWTLFTWITGALLSCPVLFSRMARFYYDAKLCLIDWSVLPAYSATLGVLVLGPAATVTLYTYGYVLRKYCNIATLEHEQSVVLDNDTTIIMAFYVIVAFTVSWLPWFSLRAYETFVLDAEIDSVALHFTLLWLGIGGGLWKLIIYTCINADFRKRFLICCRFFCSCCRSKDSRYSEYNALSQRRQRFG